LYAFSVLYGVPIEELMDWCGIPPASKPKRASTVSDSPRIKEAPGMTLGRLRETAGKTMRDVETFSARIAEAQRNEEFSIPPSRLTDIETKGVLPSIFRLYSLATTYGVPVGELFKFYGVDPNTAEAERLELGMDDFIRQKAAGVDDKES
jgi:transcriptional regulator with XRE-family HTH domain